ncbi:MAG: 3-keto-5-aminohexanoate cleavage protein [Deltaproteobacteria bacterium]|nr:3-keto-5-aminohexanoate cleavage protein [Deltaproteobacteria bacterium]
MEKLIITVAVTGSLTSREQNPHIPHTPEEIAGSTIEAHRAGAAVVHLHVREPSTGKPVQDVDLFRETIRLIRKECDIVINVSTGGGPGMTFDERIGIIPSLSAEPDTKPEMASLNSGSINFGILSRKKRKFVLDAVQLNPWSQLLRFADTMKEHGVKPESEIYDAGMINNVKILHDISAIDPPLHFQFVLGVLGGMQAAVENLVFLKAALPQGSTWSLCVVGLDIYTLAPVAIGTGGHVRVGLEDCIYISDGVLAESNAQMVSKIAGIASQIGREIATPREARKILSLDH